MTKTPDTIVDHPRIRLHYRIQHLPPRPLESLPDRSLGQERRRRHWPPARHPKQQLLDQHQLAHSLHPLRHRPHLQQLLRGQRWDQHPRRRPGPRRVQPVRWFRRASLLYRCRLRCGPGQRLWKWFEHCFGRNFDFCALLIYSGWLWKG